MNCNVCENNTGVRRPCPSCPGLVICDECWLSGCSVCDCDYSDSGEDLFVTDNESEEPEPDFFYYVVVQDTIGRLAYNEREFETIQDALLIAFETLRMWAPNWSKVGVNVATERLITGQDPLADTERVMFYSWVAVSDGTEPVVCDVNFQNP